MSELSTFNTTAFISDHSISDDEEAAEEEDYKLIGRGEYQLLVGIRYYNGVAHPGEYVKLIRELNNPYDRNAIRTEKLHGEEVGHLKGTSAKFLSH
mmetsp:Transcript_16749/g.24762  ORF Transcript_16749/g.24762 Transcript_16749/m.24762 type:complete len:96 (-) Transcript_16749:28-315(-)